MNNDDRYLSRPPKKLSREITAQDRLDEREGAIYGILAGFGLLISVAGLAVGLCVDGAEESLFVSGMMGICTVLLIVRSVPLLRKEYTGELGPDPDDFGEDKQTRGLYGRIRAVTKHSTAGWGDDLWQAFFTVGQLIDEKRSLNSVTLAQELHDEIDVLVGELDEMITARKAMVDQRRRLGMDLTVPGTEAQRIEAGVTEEMEELAMRPLLRQRVAEIKNEGPGELT